MICVCCSGCNSIGWIPAVVIVCILIFGLSLVTMDKNDVEEVPEALLKVVEGNVRFTTSLYKAVASKDGNVFISPISVEVVLALAYTGAAGNTAEQIASALHLPADREDVKAGFLSLLGLLKSTEDVTLEIANKIFSQSGYGILSEYRAIAEKSFLSGAEELDFADAETSRNIINSWVETKTKNKITDIIPSGVLDNMTRLVLVNAVYFKGLWEKQFSADSTAVSTFHLNSKESKEVPMMHKKDKFGYLQSEELDADILQMHYKGRSISMFIILPHDIDGISELENRLAGVDLSKILTRLPVREVEVSVPKFKLEETTNLNNILTELGMSDMFIPNEADFSGISGERDLHVSSVLQKAFVEVNEEGSEAAAATVGVMRLKRSLMSQETYKFIANHPFIFFIHERRTDLTLFIGRYMKPTAVVVHHSEL
uniref:Putative serine protease inhibitor 1 isoform B n=1 Tax=Reticulitermes speratus TaxID=60591 RepID=A0A1V1FTD1_9NEOP